MGQVSSLSSVAQSLVRDASRSWNNGTQQPVVVTYSLDYRGGGFDRSTAAGAAPLTAALQDSARTALQAWASVSGIHVLEVPDIAGGLGIDLRFRLGTVPGGSYEVTSPGGGGDITLDAGYSRAGAAPGSEAFEALLLTTGYALGLNALNAGRYAETTMALYNPANPRSTGLKAADVQAIQHTYGTQQAEDALHIRWSWDAGRAAVLHLGDDSAQTMTGTALRDIIHGFGGNDSIKAGEGNDLINPGTGFNTVSGGGGLDVLQVDAFRNQTGLSELRHRLETDSDGQHDSLAGRLSHPGGATVFSGIETIAFADGRLVFNASDPVAQVVRLYQAALGRAPDAMGREFWTTQVQQGTPLSKLADSFLGSAEFLARFGQQDDAGFVATAYRQALGREPDAGGQNYWQGRLAEGLSRAEMLAGFSESTENRALTAPLLANGIWDADEQVAAVARLYRAVLGRAPDAEGLRFWDSQADGGAGEARMANLFAASPEFQSRFPGATDTDFVHAVYQNTLGRGPDPSGQAFWVDQLSHGMTRGEMVASVSHSPEFLQLTAGMIEGGITFA